MNKAYTRINWQNEPSVATPLNETNLNKVDIALNEVDNRVISLDTAKAEQSELLSCLSDVSYNQASGVFTFTFKNGTTYTADLNIEKIPVAFALSGSGILTMTTTDGTAYTADLTKVIREYDFDGDGMIEFEVMYDDPVNDPTSRPYAHVMATIVDGSITADKLQPNFLADCQTAKAQAESAASSVSAKALRAEGYALGTQNGEAVTSGSPYYHNNAKYFKEQAQAIAGGSYLPSEIPINFPTNGNYQNLEEAIIDLDDTAANVLVKTDIADNLTSTSATKVLSAKQGKALNDKIEQMKGMTSAWFSIQPTEWVLVQSSGTSLYKCVKDIDGITEMSVMYCEILINPYDAAGARATWEDWSQVISKEYGEGNVTFYALSKPTHTLSISAMFT